MSIKFNKHGLRVNNITSDNITTSGGSKFLNEKESDLKYISNQTVQNYNWTPDWRNNVRGVDVTTFETPVNGWLSINKSQSPIFVNGKQMTILTSNGSYQSMLKSGDIITSESEFTYTFAPCKSEVLDWREVPTDYDIWRGAIFRNDDGSVESRDLYIPDATNWKTNVYDANELTITKVENNKAYNGEEFVCNIQCEKIKKGNNMFKNCSNLITFISDLPSLTDGSNMFYKCTNLTTFTSDLPSLTKGSWMFYDCDKLTSFTSDLSSLTDGSSMFYSCTNLTTFNSDLPSLTDGSSMFSSTKLTTFNSDLPSLTDGGSMFSSTKLTTFTSDLPSLTDGSSMFYNCTNLTTFSSDLSSLKDGGSMFYYCSNLTTFTSDLPNLTNGYQMFYECENLTTFSSDLSNLKDGEYMFRDCENLTTFNSDLPNLTNGNMMFCSCSKLTSFNSDLSKLTDGSWMFNWCPKLTSFSSDLSSLTGGTLMFGDAKLSVESFRNIASTINDVSGDDVTHNIDLGSIPLLDFEDYNVYLEEITSKGWNIECSMVGPSFFNAKKVINNTFYNSNDEVIGTYDTSSILYGGELFRSKSILTTFESDLSSLIKGTYMFYGCTNLTSFNSDLSSLTSGSYMFEDCSALTSFTSDLSSLTSSRSMFEDCTSLTSFTTDLSSLTDGSSMFYECTNLTSFSSDLSSLKDGYCMFYYCSNLTSFTTDLSSLTSGYSMFSNCKLDAPSVERILTSIPTITSGSTLTLGIQSAAASKFAELTGKTPTTTQQSVSYKGWSINVKINS